MAKSIEIQIAEMRKEIAEAKQYKKQVQKHIKKLVELLDGNPIKTAEKIAEKPVEKIIEKEVEKVIEIPVKIASEFEQKISQYYGLETEEQKQEYLRVMLNQNSKSYWERNRAERDEMAPRTLEEVGKDPLWP